MAWCAFCLSGHCFLYARSNFRLFRPSAPAGLPNIQKAYGIFHRATALCRSAAA
jgi:hypothetical protein